MVLSFFKSSYTKVKTALTRARSFLSSQIRSLFQGKIDEETIEKLEEILYEADFGVQTAIELTKKMREKYRQNPSLTSQDYIEALRTEILFLLKGPSLSNEINVTETPYTILIVGVNGNGKTTSVAKLAYLFKQSGKKVLVGAADTFRAAAIEQLEMWAQRLDIDIVKGTPKSDPAAVAFDALQAAQARQVDVAIIDTAGRLHNKTPLMQELEKIRRSCKKSFASAPHETLLVLDATTGQNAIEQAKQFHHFTPLTGLILTKLDGTAKGGIVIAIQQSLGIPVKFIGTGENLDDLQPFDAESFVKNLFD